MTAVTIAHDEPELDPAPSTSTSVAMRLAALAVGTAVIAGGLAFLAGWPWVVVIVALLTIIMLHELGHFVTAKWSGMKATEFFIGFGPRLWSIRRGETEYGIKAFPLGGYVKILGMTSLEELEPTDEPRSFVNQTTSKRVLVASAGSIVHVLIALTLAFAALFFIGQNHQTNLAVVGGLDHVAGQVSPAQAAGLKTGDVIVSIDGKSTTVANVVQQIQAADGNPLVVVVQRGGVRHTLVATPRIFNGSAKPILGIFPSQQQFVTHPGILGSITNSASLVWQVTDQTVHVFTYAFSPAGVTSLASQVTNPAAAKAARASGTQSVSILGALILLVDALKAGTYPFLGILISLNISLAVLNMLPMLPLDGGHVAIALYERVRTRKGKARYRADVNKLMPVVYLFLGFLVLFVASKMYLDIAHGTANPFG